MDFFDKIKRIFKNKKIIIFFRVLTGLVFIVSAMGKIMDLPQFGRIIYSYSVVPDSWVAVLAIIIPYLELSLGIMLILDLYSGIAGFIGFILIFFFTLISMYRYINGDVSDCGCFGKLIQRDNDLTLLAENLVLMTALYFIIHVKCAGKCLNLDIFRKIRN